MEEQVRAHNDGDGVKQKDTGSGFQSIPTSLTPAKDDLASIAEEKGNAPDTKLRASHPSDAVNRKIDIESGTEADDEHHRLGVPASRSRSQNSLKGLERTLSSSSTDATCILTEPLLSAAERRKMSNGGPAKKAEFTGRRRIELLRRVLEVLLMLGLGQIVHSRDGQDVGRVWPQELALEGTIIGSLMLLYPLRLLYYIASRNSFDKWPQILVPKSFDPAVLLYPPLMANYVPTLLSATCPEIILPNIILGVSSMTTELIPSFANVEGTAYLHWLLSSLPLFAWEARQSSPTAVDTNYLADTNLPREKLILLYPIHRTVCHIIRFTASTSLLETEVQLLSITLINVLLLSMSPQMVILKSLLWGGGFGIIISCTYVLRWLVALERVPKWRFRRVGNPKHALKSQPKSVLKEPLGKLSEILHFDRPHTLDSEDDVASVKRVKPMILKSEVKEPVRDEDLVVGVIEESEAADTVSPLTKKEVSDAGRPTQIMGSRTPSGRKKRSASKSLQRFYSLTETEATRRKWLVAGYVYACIAGIIIVTIRTYVQFFALSGTEPLGWALAYLFGNIRWFRMQIMLLNLNSWVPLPPYEDPVEATLFQGPWIANFRHNFGLANTRLLISGYLATILTGGLLIVFYLSSKPVAVDTRRKVFHFMMVFMLMPTVFVDPLYLGFALSLVLAIFLLLDMLRACCVPPLSKPMNWFLAPYVDGRDLRGPVVVSHIFLLIGCAIPLWLSLGTMHRDDSGWDIADNVRDVSMLSGVICVGMGDAFASLIGRRFGKRKWIWPGGKTLEGSAAFAAAVTGSLTFAKAYLVFGGWNDGGASGDTWLETLGKASLAGTLASAMEAVLTGGNDNVVVPVVFWLAVKGLRI